MKNVFILLFLCLTNYSLNAEEVGILIKAESLKIEHSYLRSMPPGQSVTAAFLTVTNQSKIDCLIVSSRSPLTSRIEFHQHQHVNDMMQMRPIESVLVGAGKTVRFEPGGLHLMLFNMEKLLRPGHKAQLELLTDKCGNYAVTLDIRSVLEPVLMEH
jgi:copper(I)-binding protein